MVDLAVPCFRNRPLRPSVFALDDRGVLRIGKFSAELASTLEVIEVFEEEDPGGLLDVIELARATSILVEDVIDILEGVLEHSGQPFADDLAIENWRYFPEADVCLCGRLYELTDIQVLFQSR